MRITIFGLVCVALALGVWLFLVESEQHDQTGGIGGAPAGPTERPAEEPGLQGHASASEEIGPEASAAPPPRTDGVVAVGIVVGEHRRPVQGAEVVAEVNGRESGRATTTADGAFEVVLPPRGSDAKFGRLHVRKGQQGAMRVLYIGPDGADRLDFGRISLSILHPVTVRVLRGGAPVAGAQVVLGQTQNARPGTRFPMVRSDAEGLARFEAALGPRVALHAWVAGSGRAHQEIGLPRDGVVDLELPANRRASIRVQHGVTHAPVAGAEVYVGGGGTLAPPAGTGCLPAYGNLRTGEDGAVVVSGLPQGYVWVVARAPGLAMRNQGLMVERVILQPTETEKVVTLYPYRSVRFPISDAGAGAPPAGTAMEVRRYQPLTGYDVGQPAARIEDGQLVLEPFPPGHDWGHVVTEDGCWAKWMVGYDKDVGDPVEFRRIHDVRVRLRWRDGTPAAGQVLWANLQPRGRSAPVRTDGEGEVLFPQLIAETMTVLWTPTEAAFGMPIGSVSLVADPGVQTLTIDRPIDVVVALRRGGTPFIPEDLVVSVPDMDPDRPGGGDRSLYREFREDATTGELAFRWLPLPDGTAPPVTVAGKDITESTVTPKQADDGVWRGRIDLARASTLRVTVRKPEGGRYRLRLERWIEEEGRWRYLHDHPGYRQGVRAVDGVHTMPALAAGRYRIVERFTSQASDPIEIRDGQDVDLEFDLTNLVLVKGRVVVPEGENPAYAAVHVKGRDSGQVSRSNPARVKPDGTFEFRAARGQRLTLVAQHPLLQPQGVASSFVAGKDEPTVHFQPGPHLVFQLEGSDLTTPEPNMSTYPSWWSPVQVRIREPGKWDLDGATYRAIARDGRCRCTVPGTGTFTVRVEQGGFVPVLLENVRVGPGATDLGTLRFSKGATLTVRLLAGDGGVPQNLHARAVHQGKHAYACYGSKIEAGDPPTITMSGLGRGTFKVSLVRAFVKSDALGEAVVESDGESDLAVDIRLP